MAETQDMINFQTFTRNIPVKHGWPDVVASGVPVSVILSAHHNLVAFGTPFYDSSGVWVNPPKKAYYAPEEAINMISSGMLFQNDEHVKAWMARTDLTLDVPDVPGMAAWTERANAEWALPGQMSAAWHHGHEDGVSNFSVPSA